MVVYTAIKTLACLPQAGSAIFNKIEKTDWTITDTEVVLFCTFRLCAHSAIY